MSVWEAILLGLVQGLTEFLPVSSSGHLTIFKELFSIETGNLSFEIVVHAATVLSTIVAFRKEIAKLLAGFFNFKMNREKDYIFKICLSMIPVMIVGLFFKEQVERIFGSGILIVGLMLLLTAVLLTISETITKIREQRSGGASEGKPVGYREAFIIGIAQAFAVMPGLSRSGSTISTGLMLGVSKNEIAKFSFLMVLVPILGETFLSLIEGDFGVAESGISAMALALGAATAFLSGLFACTLMINLVKRARLHGFAIYCAIAGAICIAKSIWG